MNIEIEGIVSKEKVYETQSPRWPCRGNPSSKDCVADLNTREQALNLAARNPEDPALKDLCLDHCPLVAKAYLLAAEEARRREKETCPSLPF